VALVAPHQFVVQYSNRQPVYIVEEVVQLNMAVGCIVREVV
jgi:hypothetical protein